MLKISLTFDKPPELSGRKWSQFKKEAHLAVGQKWQAEMLPDHFTRAASAKYQHQPRSPKYLKRKRRTRGVKYGGTIDNVFTGAMEAMLKSTAAVRSTNHNTTIRMTGPRYITMRRFEGDRSKGYKYGKGRRQTISATAGLQPDKKAEVTRVTDEQVRTLSETLLDETVSRYKLWKEPRTYKV